MRKPATLPKNLKNKVKGSHDLLEVKIMGLLVSIKTTNKSKTGIESRDYKLVVDRGTLNTIRPKVNPWVYQLKKKKMTRPLQNGETTAALNSLHKPLDV